MQYCPHCGLLLQRGTEICPRCGAAVPPPAPPRYDLPAPPAPHPYYADPPAAPAAQGLSTGGYLGMLVLNFVPVVGLVVMCIWAFGGTRNPARRDLARALLLFTLLTAAVLVCLYLLLSMWLSAMQYAYFMSSPNIFW